MSNPSWIRDLEVKVDGSFLQQREANDESRQRKKSGLFTFNTKQGGHREKYMHGITFHLFFQLNVFRNQKQRRHIQR